MASPILNWKVYRRQTGGVWQFWMYARGKSAKQVQHNVWWTNRTGKYPLTKENIKVDGPIVLADDQD